MSSRASILLKASPNYPYSFHPDDIQKVIKNLFGLVAEWWNELQEAILLLFKICFLGVYFFIFLIVPTFLMQASY